MSKRESERRDVDRRGQEAQRECLCCGKLFRSEHKGHRVCCDCKEREVWQYAPTSHGDHHERTPVRGAS